jgi:hypothetical protein
MCDLVGLLEKSSGVTDVDTVKSLIRILHRDVDPRYNYFNRKYAIDIANGVLYWRKQEVELLKYTPTADEKLAGCEKLARETGPAGVAITLAEKFGVSDGPDAVFEWPYATVFQVLRIDLERSNFQKRLQRIKDSRHRHGGRDASRG